MKKLSAIVFSYFFGATFILSLPIWVGAIVEDYSLSERSGGFIGSIELGGVAISMLLFSRYVHLVNKRSVSLVAAVVAIAGNLVAALADPLPLVVALRALVGLSLGAVVTCSLSTAAGTSHAQRTFSIMEISLALMASAFYYFVAGPAESYGSSGVFGTLVVALLICVPFFIFLPTERFADARPADVPGRLGATEWSGMCGHALVFVAMFSFWTFVERIGSALQMSMGTVGPILSAAFIIALAGPATAPWVVRTFGRRLPVATAILVMAAFGLLLTHASSVLVYGAAVIVIKTFFLFYSVVTNGLFASLDPSGKMNGMGLAFAVVGTSMGPSYGGLVLTDQKYALLGWFALLPWLMGLVLLLPAARKAEIMKRTGGPTI